MFVQMNEIPITNNNNNQIDQIFKLQWVNFN